MEGGSSLASIAPSVVKDPKTGKEYPVLAALVDHKVKALDFEVYAPHSVEFVGYNHPEGRRTYLRSLSFLAQCAARKLFPDRVFKINHSLPSGLYCKLRGDRITDEQIMALREEMRRLVEADLPFTHRTLPASEAIELFEDISDLDFLFLRLQAIFDVTLIERRSVIIFDEVQEDLS